MTNMAVHRFAYRGCDVSICVEGMNADGAVTGYASVSFAGEEVRTLAAEAIHRSDAAAMSALARQARHLIDSSTGSKVDAGRTLFP